MVAVAPRGATAQVGATTDIITGTVTGPDSQPLAGAVVQAISLETQISRQRTTDARGRFTIVFPDGGGQYQLIARYIGMAPTRLTIARQADEDRLVADIRLGLAAIPLEPVTVTARRNPRDGERPTPGSTERDLSPQLLARLPIDASDLNTIATLAPGVVGIAGTDSTDAAFSVAGQRTTTNDITLDGMSFGSGSVPQDAVRSTRVVTSTYDVARGQFSGGLVASTTRSGTNGLTPGTPFTPTVGSDINGDGARNDRAFVFNPATTTDTSVARAMRTLLANAPAAVESCLATQLDQVAARNSCRGPWQPSLDLQLNWRPEWLGLDRRLTISLVTVNLLGGLDEWLHGTANLRGWGFSAAPDPVLLYVRGFDPTSESFRYAVNQRFGAIAGANGGVTVPFQLGIQAHLAIGPDRTRDRLRSAFGGGRGGRGGLLGADSSGAAFAARFAQILPNPISVMVGVRDTLKLTESQMSALQNIADSLDAQNAAVRDSLQADVQRAGDRPDPGILFARMRPRLQAGRANIRKALERARAVLTPEQWKQLPDALKSPASGGRGRGGGAP